MSGSALKINLGYGALEVGVSAMESYLRLYLLIFYTDRIGISPSWAGIAVAMGVLWDGLMDPLIGRLCDRTKSRFGPRIPWIIIGSPLLIVSFILMFSISPTFDATTKILWLIFTNIAVNTSMTLVSIPHLALGADIAVDQNERTKMYASRTFMSIVGLFCGIAAPAIIRALHGPSGESIDLSSAILLGVLLLLATLMTVTIFLPIAKQHADRRSLIEPEFSATAKWSTWHKLIFSHSRIRPLLFLMFAYFIATLGQGVNSSLALYYYKYRLQFSEAQLQNILMAFMLVLVLSIPFWVLLSRYVQKNYLVAAGVGGLGVMSSLVYTRLVPGDTLSALIAGGVGGILLGSIGLLESLLVDTAQHCQFAERDNGLLFGLWKFNAKAARAVSIAGAGHLLTAIGYTAGSVPAPHVTEHIAWIFGPGVGLLFIAGAMCLLLVSNRKI